MNDYGIVVRNANGGLMLDSRKVLASYVVSEAGSGSSVSTPTADDFVFISSSVVDNDLVYYGENDGLGNYQFKTFNMSTDVVASATVDYFVIRKALSVTPTADNYGLRITNDDNSLQFDTRTIKTNNHFSIIAYFPFDAASGSLRTQLGLNTYYVDISRWTNFDGSALPDYQLAGVSFGTQGMRYEGYDYTEEEDEDVGDILETFEYTTNSDAILIGTLT